VARVGAEEAGGGGTTGGAGGGETGASPSAAKSSRATAPKYSPLRPTPIRPCAGFSVVVALIALVCAVCHVPVAVRYWPVSARVTSTCALVPVGTSDTRTQPLDRYADVGEVTVPSTRVSAPFTSSSCTFSPRVTTAAR